MKRRNFIKTGLMGTAAISMAPTVLLSRQDCNVTNNDILGPYWAENHPYRVVLANIDEPGTRIHIAGTVKANDCETPIQNAIVDVWHANDDGCYTIFQECDSGNTDEDPYNLRGQMLTNENGEYAFESIWPGYYTGRPRHFHYKITTPNGLELVTQCYFESDPEVDDDWIETHPGLVIPLEEGEEGEEGLYGIFDIVMDETSVEVSADDAKGAVPSKPFLNNNYPNPFNNTTQIEFGIPRQGHVSLTVYDMAGKWIVNLVDGTLPPGTRVLQWNGTDSFGNSVPSGNYLLVMKSGGFTRSKKIVLLK
jgi:protocatechuate 3,4-dioxygenase beta subunit